MPSIRQRTKARPLISFLAKLNCSVYLGIALRVIDTFGYKVKSLFFQEILVIYDIFKKIVYCFIQFNRRWIFEIYFFLKSNTIYSVTTLRNAIIFTIKNL